MIKLEGDIEYANRVGLRLICHRYRYYILVQPEISDFEYDVIERVYEELCRELKIEPVTNMVGFDERHPVAQRAKQLVDTEQDDYSIWLKEMKEVWARLGPPRYRRNEEKEE